MKDTRTEELRALQIAHSRYNLRKSNLDLLNKLERNPESIEKDGYNIDAIRKASKIENEETITWDGELLGVNLVIGAWKIYDGCPQIDGWNAGLAITIHETWGSIVWNTDPTGMTFNQMFTSVGVIGGWTNIQFWNQDGGAFVGAWNGGGIDIGGFVGGGTAGFGHY